MTINNDQIDEWLQGCRDAITALQVPEHKTINGDRKAWDSNRSALYKITDFFYFDYHKKIDEKCDKAIDDCYVLAVIYEKYFDHAFELHLRSYLKAPQHLKLKKLDNFMSIVEQRVRLELKQMIHIINEANDFVNSIK